MRQPSRERHNEREPSQRRVQFRQPRLTMTSVRFLLACVNLLPTGDYAGFVGQKSGLCRTGATSAETCQALDRVIESSGAA